MAEEASENQQAGEEVDYKAKYEAMKSHAREWEKKAKENQGAASELEKLKEEQLSEIEKAQNRAKEAESKLSEYEADKARAEAVAKVADEAKVPTEFVSMLNGADADELAVQVKRILEILPAYPTRSDDGGAAGTKFEHQSECHCSKTAHLRICRGRMFEHQSECHCSKTRCGYARDAENSRTIRAES